MLRPVTLIALIVLVVSLTGCSEWPLNGQPMPVL